MKLQKIEIVHDFSQPVEQVFGWLSDHNNLSAACSLTGSKPFMRA
jgi:hypothetical protein